MAKFRMIKDWLFLAWCLVSTTIGVLVLVIMLTTLYQEGQARLDWRLINNMPSIRYQQAGAKPAIVGSLWVVVLTGLIAVPVGVAAAIYLEEFQKRKTPLTRFIQLNISNLAGVPSIVYGILGLTIFVRWMQLGASVIAGALTMALLILPVVIIVTQEALRAVPRAYREASLALGGSDWQTISRQVIPSALPGIFTGVILALSRAIGETAPLIVVGAASFVRFLPDGVLDGFTVLPIQIFNWTSDPKEEFQELAGSAIIVLMAALLFLNSIAIGLRYRARKKLGTA